MSRFDELPVSAFLNAALEKRLSEIIDCRTFDIAGFGDWNSGINLDRQNYGWSEETVVSSVIGRIDDEMMGAFEEAGLAQEPTAMMKAYRLSSVALAIMSVAEGNNLEVPELPWTIPELLREPEKSKEVIYEVYQTLGKDESRGDEGWFYEKFDDAMDEEEVLPIFRLSIEADYNEHGDGDEASFSVSLAIGISVISHDDIFENFSLAEIKGSVPETPQELDEMLDSLIAKGLPSLNVKEKRHDSHPASSTRPA